MVNTARISFINSMSSLVFVTSFAIAFLIWALVKAAELPASDDQTVVSEDAVHPDRWGAVANDATKPGFYDQIQSSGTTIASILTDEEGICVLALNSTRYNTLTVDNKSSLTANGCSVHSNSSSSIGLAVDTSSVIKASTIYTSGGYNGPLSSYSSNPISNTTPFDDPLSGRIQPTALEECDQNNVALKSGENVLNPGTYCGGIIALGASQIKLEPGIYIMKDGSLVLGGKASLSGESVGFVFEGSTSVFSFGLSTTISLTAPIEGPMSGILFFEGREAPSNREFIIRSRDAQLLEGAIYLPRGRLVVDSAGFIGQKSKWTAIIANQIEIKNGPSLEINSDYDGSTIPVPEGIWPTTGFASLTN